LTIQKGKLTAFIGPNGAGKSTLLACMSALLMLNLVISIWKVKNSKRLNHVSLRRN
jgi:ABC-type enterochelin transport system ATPase subunit